MPPNPQFPPMAQDALRDPEKWNDAWDAFLKRHRTFPNGPYNYLFQYALKVIQEIPCGLEGTLAGYPGLVSGTCAIQRNITAEALDHFTHDAFEVKWMDAGSEVRGRHILRAMAAVCSKARNLNEARNYCPELSLRRLRLDGKLFLGLLKSVLLEDASFIPSKPIFVPHAGWDAWAAAQSKLNNSEEEKIALAEIMILRTKLICHVIQFTMRSFFNKPPPELYVEKHCKPIKKPNHWENDAPAELVALLGAKAANIQWRDHQAGVKARHSEHLARCSYMSCTKTEPLDGSVKSSRCKSCFEKMQRQVLYCSGACQKADWRLRHKAICGKPLDFDTVSWAVEHPLSASTSDMRTIGPPIDGYKRSLALTAQVTALNMNPTVDYRLYDTHNAPVDIDLGAGYPQEIFRARRVYAMTTGNELCVGFIAHYLCLWFLAKAEDGSSHRGITPKMITVLAVQQMQNEHPLRRPFVYAAFTEPLLTDAPPELLASLNEDENVKKLCGIVVTLD
ncbi:hypothetical protein DFH08DRAFT_906568 [Mycena albidolilacea]|uniref:MYND-type domain-containing protein n=1 Tax=Mycena albidolilacea TaxID=1033008 RepID=A0AAD6YY98_9AGAR|nr:hypothetical protein DFH08DRAFT_906568 [Mycena albidolilacea]